MMKIFRPSPSNLCQAEEVVDVCWVLHQLGGVGGEGVPEGAWVDQGHGEPIVRHVLYKKE
jgi:hypothetical protein